jgi:hypothetical protein
MLDLGHRSMNTTRLRLVVMGCIAPLVLAMLTMNHLAASLRSGLIWGQVRYNGRPLEGGTVLFVSVVEDYSSWGFGSIGKDGRYRIDPAWRRKDTVKTEYRIGIIPNSYTFTEEDVVPPVQRVLPASTAAQFQSSGEIAAEAQPKESGTSSIPRRFNRIWTSGLRVTLDHESARVDIDLKD